MVASKRRLHGHAAAVAVGGSVMAIGGAVIALGETMRWFLTMSATGFSSVVSDSDHASSGKWIVERPGQLWEEIEDAAVEGRLLAVKKARDHSVALVYCRSSDEETVAETLAILREIGVEGQLRYKSDRATDQRRDEYLYDSDDFEPSLTRTIR